MNKSKKFMEDIYIFSQKSVPDDVVKRAKKSLLDYIAVTCAGAKFQEEKIKKYCRFSMPEEGRFKAIGLKKDMALKEAVFLNGLNSHALDYDDGTNSGIIHLGSPVFSLLLPLAQRHEKNIDDVIKAAVIGYEVSYTLAVSIQPGHKAMGYHATGTCGTIGAAVAAGYMLDFSKDEIFQAFASACVAASGMLKVLDDGSELKPYNVAKASLLALTAVELAKAGFVGHEDPLGGRGFLKMMTGNENVELKDLMLNGTYAIMKSYTKPYASCRYTHPAVEAAIKLRQCVNPDKIDSIDIKTYRLAVAGHDHTDVAGSYSAKMSIPYAVTAGIIFGKAGLTEFSENCLKDEKVLGLIKKIHVSADDALSDEFPDKQSAIVTVSAGKDVLVKRVDFPKGEPENPLSDDEFKERYNGLMEYANVTDVVATDVFEKVYEEGATVNEILKSL